VQSFDRSAFRDAIKVIRECGSCVISALGRCQDVTAITFSRISALDATDEGDE
jgi:hypothetical protein